LAHVQGRIQRQAKMMQEDLVPLPRRELLLIGVPPGPRAKPRTGPASEIVAKEWFSFISHDDVINRAGNQGLFFRPTGEGQRPGAAQGGHRLP